MKTIISIVIFLAVFTRIGVAQEIVDKSISETERKQVVDLALSFADNLRETKDFGSIVKALFVPDFTKRHADDPVNYNLGAIEREVAKQVSGSDLERFYILDSGYEHCKTLYSLSRKELDENAARGRDSYPPGVFLLEKALYPTKDYVVIRSVAQFHHRMKNLPKAEKVCRQYLIANPVESSPSLQREIDYRAKRDHHFIPDLQIFSETTFGFPSGTRAYIVDVPFFQLTVVKVDGLLKIINVAWE